MNEFGDKRIFTFADSFAMQKPYKEKFAEWLRSRPKVKEVKEAGLKDDLAGTDFFVMVDSDDQAHAVQVTYAIQLKTDFRADETGNLPVPNMFFCCINVLIDLTSIIFCPVAFLTILLLCMI